MQFWPESIAQWDQGPQAYPLQFMHVDRVGLDILSFWLNLHIGSFCHGMRANAV